MIEKISVLYKESDNSQTKALCESAMSTINAGMFKNITTYAKKELEKAVVENLFEGLSKIEDKGTQKWLKNAKRIWHVKNLGVMEAINFLSETEGKDNAALMETLEMFKDQLEKLPEVLLYESFITAMQSFNYFPKVGNAIEDIKNRAESYEHDVSITKIIETMKRTQSSYLIPLIEDLVQDYLENKNSQTKQCLKEGLIKFSYDPFIRDIINLVAADVASLQLEYANAICDIEKVYSPIMYIGENEAIFSVKGSYYIKKGNNVSRLNKSSIEKLDKNFVALCEAINSPSIEIDDKKISVFDGPDKAVIFRDKVIVNEQEISEKEFRDSAELAPWTGKGKFLGLVKMLSENFDEIAEVDFAKRVFLKENVEHAADVFKLRGNISIATYNPMDGTGTFYRNINPIQAKNLMMEHLRFDVSKAFEDLLLNEEKIKEEIVETKKVYLEYIMDLEKKIDNFSSQDTLLEVNLAVVEALKDELNDVRNEYKDYLNIVESYSRPLSETAISLEIEGPLTIEVGGQKYVVPIPQVKGADTSQTQGSLQFQGTPTDDMTGEDQFGTKVGDENLGGDEASAVTFNDSETELLGGHPSIESDEVDLGADRAEADAEAAEAEDLYGEEGDEEGAEEAGEEGAEEETGDEGEIKIGGEEGAEDGGLDLDFGNEEEEEEEKAEKEPEEEKKEKKEKIEDSTSNNETPKKKKVFLTKKKSQ